jgi:hypothetical protein
MWCELGDINIRGREGKPPMQSYIASNPCISSLPANIPGPTSPWRRWRRHNMCPSNTQYADDVTQAVGKTRNGWGIWGNLVQANDIQLTTNETHGAKPKPGRKGSITVCWKRRGKSATSDAKTLRSIRPSRKPMQCNQAAKDQWYPCDAKT